MLGGRSSCPSRPVVRALQEPRPPDRFSQPATGLHDPTSPRTLPAMSVPTASVVQVPDALGRFGPFGGRFVPETLMDALNRLTEEYARAKNDLEFQAQLEGYLK